MPLTAGNFAALLEPGLREVFLTAFGRPTPIMETLFGVKTSNKRAEEYQGMGSLGLVPPFNGTVPYPDFAGGYKTRLLNYVYVQGITVERELFDDDQYGAIEDMAMSLGDTFARTVEHDAAQIFVNGFTDSGTYRNGESTNGADGVALLSAAHPHSPSNTGSTQSNEGTLALNIANLDTTRQLMRAYTDDQDQLIAVEPQCATLRLQADRRNAPRHQEV